MKKAVLFLAISFCNLFLPLPVLAMRYGSGDRVSKNIIDRRITSENRICLSEELDQIKSATKLVATGVVVENLYADAEKRKLIWRWRELNVDTQILKFETVRNSKGELLLRFELPKKASTLYGWANRQKYYYIDFPSPGNKVRLFGCEVPSLPQPLPSFENSGSENILPFPKKSPGRR